MKHSTIKSGIQEFINERQEADDIDHAEMVEFYTEYDNEEGRSWIRAIGKKAIVFNI